MEVFVILFSLQKCQKLLQKEETRLSKFFKGKKMTRLIFYVSFCSKNRGENQVEAWQKPQKVLDYILYLILSYIYIYNIKIGVQMFVCLLVCGGVMAIETSALNVMKFCTHIPTCPRKVLVLV